MINDCCVVPGKVNLNILKYERETIWDSRIVVSICMRDTFAVSVVDEDDDMW